MTLKYHWVDPELIGKSRLDCGFYKKETVDAIRYICRMKEKIKVVALNKLIDSNYKITRGIDRPGEFIDFGPLMIRAVDIQYPWVLLHNSVRVRSEIEKPYARARVQPKDILLSIAGTLGQVGLVTWLYEIANINRNVARIRLKKEEDIYYLIAFFGTRYGQKLLEREAVGSVQRCLILEDLPDIEVALPRDLNLQHAIGNKVRKAERLKELAEQELNLAKRKFYERTRTDPIFGSFKPNFWCNPDSILDRLDSWPYQPRYKQMLSEIKTIAQTKNLDEVATFVKAKASTGERKSSNCYIEIGDVDINSGRLKNKQQPETLPSGSKLLVKKGDILVSKVRPHRGAIAIVPEDFDLALATTGFCQLRVKGESFEKYYLWFVLRQSITLHQFEQWSSGSTYPTIEDEYIRKRIIIPWKEEKERKIIGELCKDAIAKQYLSDSLINNAKSDVEALIEGTLDEAKLLAESAEIEQWLKENPSPYATA